MKHSLPFAPSAQLQGIGAQVRKRVASRLVVASMGVVVPARPVSKCKIACQSVPHLVPRHNHKSHLYCEVDVS